MRIHPLDSGEWGEVEWGGQTERGCPTRSHRGQRKPGEGEAAASAGGEGGLDGL